MFSSLFFPSKLGSHAPMAFGLLVLLFITAPGVDAGEGKSPGTQNKQAGSNTDVTLDTRVYVENPIDAYFTGSWVTPIGAEEAYPRANDRTLIRRLYIDAHGKLPSFELANAYVSSSDKDKYAQQLELVLADSAMVDRLTFFLEDMLNNKIFTNGARIRNAFHDTLRGMVEAGTPWDEMVRQIISRRGYVTGEGSGYGLYAQGLDTDYRFDELDDRAGYLTESFLGVQTNCISCHQGAYHLEDINVGLAKRKREEFWGMAAFLSSSVLFVNEESSDGDDAFIKVLKHVSVDDPNFVVGNGYLFAQDELNGGEYIANSPAGRGMRPGRNGGLIKPKYLFTGEEPDEGETRIVAFARFLTKDRQFARNMVNRLWAMYFGEGFVNPANNWDLARLSPEIAMANNTAVQPIEYQLLERMTDVFIDSGYDMKALVKTILSSRLYQLDFASIPDPGSGVAGPAWGGKRRVRRLEAETLGESLYGILGLRQRYMVTNLLHREFNSLWQLPDTSLEPNPYAYYEQDTDLPYMTIEALGFISEEQMIYNQRQIFDLMTILGRGNRLDGTPRSINTHIQFSLAKMNSDPVLSPIFSASGTLNPMLTQLSGEFSQGVKTNDQVARELFLRVLFREPDSSELNLSAQFLKQDKPETVSELLWVLINHPDFAFNR